MSFNHVRGGLLFLQKESIDNNLKILSLVANTVNANRYNRPTQNLFGVLNNFKNINTSWDWILIVTSSFPDSVVCCLSCPVHSNLL